MSAKDKQNFDISSEQQSNISFPYYLKRFKQEISLLSIFFIGFLIWICPVPQGLSTQAWHLLAIFISTILGIIFKPLPMGAISFLSLVFLILSNTLTFDQAFSGFNHSSVWLIAFAFFIARGFVKTGLGIRLAYLFMKLMGKSTLGLGYGMILTDLILAPAIPSLTARSGGVVFPILQSLTKAFKSTPEQNTHKKMGAFLIMASFQGSVITSAMFLTSMAGNPLIAQLAQDAGVALTWGTWAMATIVPGFLSLLIVPYVLYRLCAPEIKKIPDAKEFANKKLKEMGKMSSSEYLMLGTFGLLITLWVFGSYFGIEATVAALIGLGILLCTKVLKWSDILEEKGAWDILFWFSILITMATFLNKFGFISWFSSLMIHNVQGLSWQVGFCILSILYFYSHYLFASNLAHIGTMFAPFLVISISLGTPPLLAALLLAFYSGLFGGLTHYSCGPAPILFGAGYFSVSSWWKLGAIISVVNILIWNIFGGLWWYFLGWI